MRLDCVLAGISSDRLTYHSKYFSYDDVPMELKPLQKPYAPIWYPSTNEIGSQWAGENGLHYSTLGDTKSARACVSAFKRGLKKRGSGAVVAKPEFPGGAVIGVNRKAVIADTDRDARRIAKHAFDRWYASFAKLTRENTEGPLPFDLDQIVGDMDTALKNGELIVGAPDTVATAIERQVKTIGVNYVNFTFNFGAMALEDALRSIRSFCPRSDAESVSALDCRRRATHAILASALGVRMSRRTKVFHSETISVYDDFLPEPVFDAVFAYCNSASYQSVHREGWTKAWRLHDGEPLHGPLIYWAPGKQSQERKGLFYPTRTAIDKFIEALGRRRADIAPIVGTAGTDWDILTVAPWIYRAGSGLSLHDDGPSYSGAYVFYVHRQWKLHWGGHLLVLNPSSDGGAERSSDDDLADTSPQLLDDTRDDAIASDPGVATCVFPKPNRLVLIKGRASHIVTRVDGSAGDHVRVSLTGFFVRPKGKRGGDGAQRRNRP